MELDSGYELFRCVACGFQFVFPRPTLEELKSVYDPPPEGTFSAHSAEQTRKLGIRFRGLLSPHSDGRSVLEVGCNTGFILHGLKQLGYSVTGTDLSETALAFARQQFGLTDLYCSEFPPDDRVGSYDIVIASHIIEHVIDPEEFVRHCARFLRKGGLLLIFTPNLSSIGIQAFGRHYPVFCPPIHINYFSDRTLRGSLAGAFETILSKTESDWKDFRNTAFNSLVSISHLLKVKRQLKQWQAVQPISPDAPPKPRALMQVVTRATRAAQLLASPAFAICDWAGAGENIILLARKR
jgi:SAM-dependent methyltransferase